jgi:hypothetical protein
MTNQTDTARAQLIAREIMQQLGAGRFQAMTGAKNFVSLCPEYSGSFGLGFRIPKAKAGINAVSVKLDEGSDTYAVEFSRVYGTKVTSKGKFTGIYCDMLQDLFEQETGLLTSMGGR